MSLQENYAKLAGWIKSGKEYVLNFPKDYDYDNSPGLELEHHINPNVTDIQSILIDAYAPVMKREKAG